MRGTKKHGFKLETLFSSFFCLSLTFSSCFVLRKCQLCSRPEVFLMQQIYLYSLYFLR